jgi:uncharacterized protein (DUF169 family)
MNIKKKINFGCGCSGSKAYRGKRLKKEDNVAKVQDIETAITSIPKLQRRKRKDMAW